MIQQVDFDIFRHNLKTLRTARGITAKDLSSQAGMKQLKRISDIEEGRGKPTFDEVYTISLLFAMSIDKLLFQELRITVQ